MQQEAVEKEALEIADLQTLQKEALAKKKTLQTEKIEEQARAMLEKHRQALATEKQKRALEKEAAADLLHPELPPSVIPPLSDGMCQLREPRSFGKTYDCLDSSWSIFDVLVSKLILTEKLQAMLFFKITSVYPCKEAKEKMDRKNIGNPQPVTISKQVPLLLKRLRLFLRELLCFFLTVLTSGDFWGLPLIKGRHLPDLERAFGLF